MSCLSFVREYENQETKSDTEVRLTGKSYRLTISSCPPLLYSWLNQETGIS